MTQDTYTYQGKTHRRMGFKSPAPKPAPAEFAMQASLILAPAGFRSAEAVRAALAKRPQPTPTPPRVQPLLLRKP